MDSKLEKVNAHLVPRPFLVGSHLTLADLVVFGVVHPALLNLPAAQVGSFTALLRWYDYVQHVADTQTKVFEPLVLQLPRFAPPPPPAAVSAPAVGGGKAAAADAGKASAAAAGGKAPAASAAKAAADSAASSSGASAKTAAAPPASAGQEAAAASSSSAAGPAPAAASGPAGSAPAVDKKADKAAKKAAKKEGDVTGAKGAAAGGGGKVKEEEEVRIDMLDLRVGQIVEVGKHPNADALYLEKIDVGEAEPRQVISGLVKFVPQEAMQGRRVVVALNLKPAKMRDVMSYGMVMCASSAAHDQVDPIAPPEGVLVGERISFEGFGNAALPEVNPKKKILERLFPDLKTDAAGTPVYKGVPFMTSQGPCTSGIPNANVA